MLRNNFNTIKYMKLKTLIREKEMTTLNTPRGALN